MAQPSHFPNGTGFWGFEQRVLASSFRNTSLQFEWETMCPHVELLTPTNRGKTCKTKKCDSFSELFPLCFSLITKVLLESWYLNYSLENSFTIRFFDTDLWSIFTHHNLEFLDVLFINCIINPVISTNVLFYFSILSSETAEN